MRFTEFKILLEAKEAPIYVVGDSIAVGIKNASNADGIAAGGKNPKQVLDMINDLINSNDLKGAIVILSSGASNATYERPNGERQSFTVATVDAQLKALKRAGAQTFLVGTGSKKSQTFTNSLGTYFVNFERERVNDQLAAAANANGAKFLGPLENFDPGLNSGKGDGIHPYGGYLSIYQAATRGVTAAPTNAKPGTAKGQGGKPGVAKVPLTSITVPTMDKGPDIADMQKVLKALGYGELLGPFGEGGVDGVIVKYTLNTVRTFQKDAGIKPITGMPDEKTIAKLNELLNGKFKGKITKSTSADVKLSHASAVKNGGLDAADIKKYGSIPQTNMTMKAKASAESYLGRSMSDDEWDYLLRATGAESAFNVKSYAMVMGSILNRARDAGKNGVISVLMARNQFQAVTGTAVDGHKPSPHFVRGPNSDQLKAMSVAAVEYLPRVSKDQKNFTATDPAAYGPGTNIAYLDQLRSKKGGSEIAGSAFNTTLV
jgi:hypothetical protein